METAAASADLRLEAWMPGTLYTTHVRPGEKVELQVCGGGASIDVDIARVQLLAQKNGPFLFLIEHSDGACTQHAFQPEPPERGAAAGNFWISCRQQTNGKRILECALVEPDNDGFQVTLEINDIGDATGPVSPMLLDSAVLRERYRALPQYLHLTN